MNYLLRSSRDSRKQWKRAGIAVSILAVLFIIHIIFPKLFPALTSSIGIPLWKTENLILENGSGVFGYFMSKRRLLEDNNSLRSENILLKNQMLGFIALEDENIKLKEVLGRVSPNKAVLAAVLTRPPTTPYDVLIVDAGESDGVVTGEKVMVGGNGVVGYVEEVLGHSSKVKLYSTSGERTDIELLANNVPAVAIGRGGGNFEAIVSRDTKVSVGEIITLPSSRQYIFGIIENVVVDPARAFQKILFRSVNNISQIKWVEIIKE